MADRDGVFAGDDPFVIAERWLAEAEKTEPNDPNAMSLATVDEAGLPDVRIVLLKAVEDGSFVFFTNYDSRKGQELATSGKAAINLHWKTLRRQLRVRGNVEKVSAARSDQYYHSRDLGSRIGAWASLQSQPMARKSELIKNVAKAQAAHGLSPARPPHWGGFRIIPDEIEFWADGRFRLHDRFRWSRTAALDNWTIQRLFP